MPTYPITDNVTGRTIEVTGDSPPTPEEAAILFAKYELDRLDAQQKLPMRPEDVPTLSAAKGESSMDKGLRTLREFFTPLVGPSEDQKLREGAVVDGEVRYKPYASAIESQGYIPAMFKPSAEIAPKAGKQEGAAAQAAAGLWNPIADVINSTLTSPGGLMTLGIGSELHALAKAGSVMAPIVERQLARGFAAVTGYEAIKNAPATYRTLTDNKASLQQKIEAATSEGLMVAGTAGALLASRSGKGTAVEKAAQKPAEAAKAAEVATEAAKPAESAPVAPEATPAQAPEVPAVAAAREAAKVEEPKIATPEGMEPRRVSERAVASKDLPPDVRETVAKSPESVYEVQNTGKLADELAGKQFDQLANDFVNPESNTAVASGAEILSRLLSEGKNSDAANTILALSKRGTTLGQLVNQFKMLKLATPEGMEFIVNRHLEDMGFDPLTGDKSAKYKGLATESIKTSQEVKVAQAEFLKDQSSENWGRVEKALKASEKADRALNGYASRVTPKEFGDIAVATMQGNLMAPISLVYNAFANITGYPLRTAGRTISAALDSMAGKGENVRLAPVSGTMVKYSAAASEIAPAIRKFAASSGSDIKKGEVGGSLNSRQAFLNLRNYFFDQSALDLATKNGRVPLTEVGKAFWEASFGLPADMMLRALQLGDQIPRAGEQARAINEFGKLRGLTSEQIARAQKSPELFFKKADLEKIKFETDRALFQQDNRVTEALQQGMRSVAGSSPVSYFLLKGFVPFTKTPINVLGEVLSFTPVGLVKLARDIKAGNIREANLTAGKVAVGTTAIAAGSYLYEKGVITPSTLSQNQKERQGSYASVPPASLNVSALKRRASGEKDWAAPRANDTWVDATKMGVTGALMSIGADAFKKNEANGSTRIGVADALAGSALGAVSYTFNQSFMRNTNTFLNSLSKGEPDAWASSYMETLGSTFAPNTLEAVSRAIRDSKPEFKDDSALKTFANRYNSKLAPLGLKLPGTPGTKELPLKRDIWGRDIPEVPEGKGKAFSVFLDVTRSRQALADPVDAELYNLWRRTGEDDVWPSIPGKRLTIGDKVVELTPAQHERLQVDTGKLRREVVDNIVKSQQWQQTPYSARIEVLKRVYSEVGGNVANLYRAQLLSGGEQVNLKPQPTSGYNP